MRFKLGVIVILLVALALPLGIIMPTQQAEGQSLRELIEERDRIKKQLDSKEGQKQTLQEQVAYTDNLIRLNELEIQNTQGQIQSTESQIVETNSRIDDLNNKLAKLDQSIKETEDIANARIRSAYKQARVPDLGVIVASESFTGVMKAYTYLKALEAEDRRVLGIMSKNRQEFADKKQSLEDLKAEKQQLMTQLEQNKQRVAVQQSELDAARDQKAELLVKAQGEVSHYSRLLAMAQAQINIMTYSGSDVSYHYFGDFKRGDVVGYVGSTGCSTGPHAHYSYTTWYPSHSGWTGGAVDPMPLFPNPLYWVGGPGVPIGTNSPYGNRDGGFHNGIDVPIGAGQPLYAAKSGRAYLKVIPVGAVRSFCPWWAPVNGPQKEIHVVHGDGSASIYAHISDIASP